MYEHLKRIWGKGVPGGGIAYVHTLTRARQPGGRDRRILVPGVWADSSFQNQVHSHSQGSGVLLLNELSTPGCWTAEVLLKVQHSLLVPVLHICFCSFVLDPRTWEKCWVHATLSIRGLYVAFPSSTGPLSHVWEFPTLMELMVGAGLMSQEAAGTGTFWKSLFEADQGGAATLGAWEHLGHGDVGQVANHWHDLTREQYPGFY